MKKLIALLAILTVAVVGMAAPAAAADKDFKLGVLFSLTGPFAPAGALAGYRGTMVAVDMINARGGIAGKYKVVPVVADAQSNPDVAIREGQRLMTVEKVPVVLGVFSSGIAVPLAPMADKNKKIFWVIIAISDKVVKDRNLKYVFRVQPMGSQWGQSTVKLLNDNFAKFGVKSAKDLKVAIIHEDGPYGLLGLQGQQGHGREVWHAGGAQRGLLPQDQGYVLADPQAQAHQARCNPAHRLLPGRGAVLPPGP